MAGNSSRAVRTRLTPKGDATRQRITAAAAELMFERGVAGTTLEAVGEAAGVGSSQIYHYFSNKRGLVEAVIEYQAEGVVGGQETMLIELDTVDGLRRWRDFLVAHQRALRCRGGCPIGSLAVELAEADERLRARLAAGFGRWEEAIRGGLQAMHERGELRADPDDLALEMLASVQGGLLLTQLQRDTRPLEVALDGMIARIAGLAGPR